MKRSLCSFLSILCIIGLVAMPVLLVAPSYAFAQDADGGATGNSSKNCNGEGVLARIVPCISKTMETSTTRLANSLSTYLWPATATFITLVIVVFAVKNLSPEGNLQRTGIIFLFKIGCVILFARNFGGFIPAVHGGIHDVVDLVSNVLPPPNDECSSSPSSTGYASDKVWVTLDCFLGKLYGFAGGNENSMLIASVFGLMAGFFFGGSFGLIAFLGVIGVLWSIFMFAFRAAFAFLNGLMLASFAILISPIFIPLLLLQVTNQYFQQWLRLLTSAFIMPVVVVGYCSFALSIYDEILFKDDSALSIRKVMDKNFAESITSMRTECLGSLLNSVIFRKFEGSASGRDLNEVLKSNSVQNMSVPQQSGGQGICIKVPNIDIHTLSDGFKNKQDFFRRIFTDGAALFLLAWLLTVTMETIITLSQQMGGGVASVLMGPVSSIEKRLKSAMEKAEQQAKQSMLKQDGSSYAGPEFLRRLPTMFREMVNGGVRGMSE